MQAIIQAGGFHSYGQWSPTECAEGQNSHVGLLTGKVDKAGWWKTDKMDIVIEND